MAIKIDTHAVRTTANQIAQIDKKITDDFASVDDAIKMMDANWNGAASDRAISQFHSMKNTFCGIRYDVVNNMVNFMNNQVGNTYENTESVLVTAASEFK